jgi:hypothetical protein
MDTRKGMLWYLVNGAMELSWFLGWAMFLSLMTMRRPFPFFETIAAFALAGFVGRFSAGKGWRIVSVLAIWMLGLICAVLLLIYGIYYNSYPLLEGGWLALFWDGPRDLSEWLVFSLNLLLILMLCVSGVAFARRPTGYVRTCNRFDLGLAAFFALFIIKLVALTKGEAMADDTLSLLFVFPFFLFGLLSIGMARMRGRTVSKAFLPGFRGIGVIMSFFAAVLLVTGGLLLFFLPGLTAAARMGYRALAAAGRPLVPVLIAILRFIFGPRGNHPAEVAMKSSSPLADLDRIVPQTHGWWMAWLEKILGWGLWGLMLLALVVGSAIVLYFIVRWLLSRTEGGGRQTTPISVRFAVLRAFWAGFWRKVFRGVMGYPRAAELYGALLAWGGRSGFPHDRGETPLEFGMRLNKCFPTLKPPVDLIIGAYNREVYGEMVLDGKSLAEANTAWQFLRSPLHWPARLKGWFAGSRP